MLRQLDEALAKIAEASKRGQAGIDGMEAFRDQLRSFSDHLTTQEKRIKDEVSASLNEVRAGISQLVAHTDEIVAALANKEEPNGPANAQG